MGEWRMSLVWWNVRGGSFAGWTRDAM